MDRSTGPLVATFLLLGALGLLFSVFHALEWGFFESRFFRIGRGRGFLELVGYVQFLLMISMCRVLWRKGYGPVLHAWAVLFLVMLIDDLVGIHEKVGELLEPIAQGWDIEPALYFSELFVMAMLEGSALLYLLVQYRRSPRPGRRFTHQLVALLLLMAGLSLGSEALHWTWVEEPIETFGITLLFAWVHRYYRAS